MKKSKSCFMGLTQCLQAWPEVFIQLGILFVKDYENAIMISAEKDGNRTYRCLLVYMLLTMFTE